MRFLQKLILLNLFMSSLVMAKPSITKQIRCHTLNEIKVSESDIFEPLQTICVLNDGDLFLLNMKNYLTENREKLDFEKLIFEISGKLNNKIIQQDYDMFQIERKEMKKGNEDESMNLVEKKSLHNNLKRLSNMRMPFRIGRK